MRRFANTILAAAAALSGFAHAETCKLSETQGNDRFVIEQSGIVVDTNTGLTWRRCSEGQNLVNDACDGDAIFLPWRSTLDWPNDSGAAKEGWRVPTIDELETLAKGACTAPTIDVVAFPNTLAKGYWSSTQVPEHTVHAWYVHFAYGGGRVVGGMTRDLAVRLVRGTPIPASHE